MAFISDKHKLIFIHIPKNAGTTISDVLTRAHGMELVGIEKGIYQHEGVGLGVPPKFRPNGINVHDTYKEIIEKYPAAKDYKVIACISNPWERIFSFWKHKVRRGDDDLKGGSFAEEFRKSNVLLLQPQLWWVDGASSIAFVYKTNVKEGLEDLFSSIVTELPKITKLNTDQNKEDYRSHYDEYSKGLVEAYYKKEIEIFGYEF